MVLEIGDLKARTCQGPTRRGFLRLGASLPGILGLGTAAQIVEGAVSRAPRAKSVVFVYNWGAPSHLDTLDPKPNAPAEYRGPFGVIPTRTQGFTSLNSFRKLLSEVICLP